MKDVVEQLGSAFNMNYLKKGSDKKVSFPHQQFDADTAWSSFSCAAMFSKFFLS
jgi:hypothetical protein